MWGQPHNNFAIHVTEFAGQRGSHERFVSTCTTISQPVRMANYSGNWNKGCEQYISKLFLMLCFCSLCSQQLLTISLLSRAAFHSFLSYRHTTVNPRNQSCRSLATISRLSWPFVLSSTPLNQRPPAFLYSWLGFVTLRNLLIYQSVS